MQKIEAIIVDDEISARDNLRYLTNTFCHNVEIIDEATNVDEAISAITKHKPQLVFLDIEMPQKNGFQLIEHFEKIDFYIIFVTAYDKYAIKAFKCSALDYLLKPIDILELKNAVKKVSATLKKDTLEERLNVLKSNQNGIKRIAIPYKSDYAIIDVKNINCIEADRMYSKINSNDGKTFITSKKLSHYEKVLSNSNFIRVHRSWVVNIDYIISYSKKDKNIVLKNGIIIPVSRSYKENLEELF